MVSFVLFNVILQLISEKRPKASNGERFQFLNAIKFYLTKNDSFKLAELLKILQIWAKLYKKLIASNKIKIRLMYVVHTNTSLLKYIY